MRKILVISRYHRDDDNPIYNSFLKGISLVRKVFFIDYFNEYSIRGKTGFEIYIKKLLQKENIEEIFFMFVSGDATLDISFICEISQNRVVYMVFWDLEQHFEIIDRYYAQCADLVFLPSNKEYKEMFKLYGIDAVWTFSLFDKEKYVLNMNRDIDVSFIGDLNKGNRKEYIEYLKQNGINVEVYGAGSKNGKISFKKMVEILNRSKISLNFSDIFENSVYSFYKKINNRIKQTKGRIIEICMSGAFLLTEKSNSLNEVLDISNIDTFSSKKELLEKIEYYLNNDKERETKAKKAQNEVITKYDSSNLAKYLNKKPTKKEYYYVDKEFKKIYGTFRWFYFLEFLKRYKLEQARKELAEVLKNGVYLKEAIIYLERYLRTINFFEIFDFWKYALIKNKMKNLDNIVIYPSGWISYHFIKIFQLNDKVAFLVDDNIKYKKFQEFYIRDFSDITSEIVVIGNPKFAEILEERLKSYNLKYINPFKFAKIDIDRIKREIDVYDIFAKLKITV